MRVRQGGSILPISIEVGNALACLRAMPADNAWRGSLGLEPDYRLSA
jgi:hypothetical protein